jgi:methyl-accepting chemotaxis protein
LNATEQRGRLKQVNELGVQLGEITDRQIDAAVAALRGKLETTRDSIFKLSLALVIAGALLAFLLSRHIARPLAELTALAQKISRGEIPRAIADTDREDEVGGLTRAFAEMSRYLRDIVERINEGISVLASSSEEILASTSQAASSTQETATAVSEIAATIEEVKQTALLASERSKVVTESAERTRQVSQEGFQAVEEALKGMRQIREQVLAVAESIMSLGDQMQAIGEIVATVGDLAEQSNLLGVNASIEAVKAGEAGKGFSVVAQEVKALADQSKQATAQVRGILGDIQRAMTKTVMLAEQGSKAVEVGHERAQAGGEVIRTLSASIDESSEVALQIAATSQQQMAGMDQIATAMEYISQASKDNVGGTRQVDVAARNLYELGLKLKGLADRFRL